MPMASRTLSCRFSGESISARMSLFSILSRAIWGNIWLTSMYVNTSDDPSARFWLHSPLDRWIWEVATPSTRTHSKICTKCLSQGNHHQYHLILCDQSMPSKISECQDAPASCLWFCPLAQGSVSQSHYTVSLVPDICSITGQQTDLRFRFQIRLPKNHGKTRKLKKMYFPSLESLQTLGR